jgi:hypothetical protein
MPGRDLPDLEERLRQLPAALAVRAPAGLAERVAHRGRLRRRLRRAGAATVVAALLAGAVLTRAVVLDRAPAPVLNPGLVARNATPAQLAGGRWQALPPVPAGVLAPRGQAAVVWTGRQLLIWGGMSGPRPFRVYDDGAAYDPATRRWTRIAPAPEAQWLEGDEGLAVWTGREMLVWGGITIPDPVHQPNLGTPARGVAYDPERRTWRRLAPRPAQLPRSGDLWTVWTGRELLVGGVEESGAAGGTTAAAYDSATDRWRMLPPSPGLTGGGRRLEARTAMWAGSRLLVWNYLRATPRPDNVETDVSGRPDTRPADIDLWAYDPTAGRWTVPPDPPEEVLEVSADAAMAWTGREVVIASARNQSVGSRYRVVTRAGRYDPDRAAWTPIAPPPRPAAAKLGRVILAWTGAALVEPGNAAYDPAGDRWLALPDAPDARALPPVHSGGAARALLRLRYQANGANRVWVLAPVS